MDIQLNDSKFQTDFDFAFLDLKANRFTAADLKFQKLVRNTNHYAAWCGMGLSKMGLLLEERSTVQEIEYCFTKAKTYESSQTENIELLYAKNIFDLIRAYYHFFEQSNLKSKEINANIIAGVGAALVGGFVSGASSSFTGKLMGLGIGAYGAVHASSALHSMSDLKEFNQKLLDKVEELYDSYKTFVTSSNPLIEQSEQSFLSAKTHINQLILTGNEKGGLYEKWYHNNLYLGLSILFWPLFVYGLYMRYKKR